MIAGQTLRFTRPRHVGPARLLAFRAVEANIHGKGVRYRAKPVVLSSSWPVSSPRKQKITTTYRMPVADWVERIRAVCQAITPSTRGPISPTPQRTGSHRTAASFRLASECPAVQDTSAAPATAARSSTAAPSPANIRINGRIDMAGAIRYEWPSSIAVVAVPSSAAEENDEVRRRKEEGPAELSAIPTGASYLSARTRAAARDRTLSTITTRPPGVPSSDQTT